MRLCLPGGWRMAPSMSRVKTSSAVTDSFRIPLGVTRMPASVLMEMAPPVPKYGVEPYDNLWLSIGTFSEHWPLNEGCIRCFPKVTVSKMSEYLSSSPGGRILYREVQ